MKLSFTCYGHPQAQGSSRAFIPKGWTRPVITSANPKLKSWRQELAGAAKDAVFQKTGDVPIYPIPSGIPVTLTLKLFYTPPKKAKGTYKPTRPDCDKALRAAADAMTGIVYDDDSQIAIVHMEKLFGAPERVEIEVEEIVCSEQRGKLF